MNSYFLGCGLDAIFFVFVLHMMTCARVASSLKRTFMHILHAHNDLYPVAVLSYLTIVFGQYGLTVWGMGTGPLFFPLLRNLVFLNGFLDIVMNAEDLLKS